MANPLSFLTSPQQAPGGSGWSPTIAYLFILVVAEMVVFGLISKALR